MVTDLEKYFFDVNGYFVIKSAVDPDSIKEINKIIDRDRLDSPENIATYHHGGVPIEDEQVFRSLINNERIMPYVETFTTGNEGKLGLDDMGRKASKIRLGEAYFIFSDQGYSGLSLHGGGTPYADFFSYHVRDGKFYNAMNAVSFVLNEVIPGQGGFACVPGSHKANFQFPFAHPADVSEVLEAGLLVSPAVSPGDAIIFTEAITHGSLPWQAPHQRRALFYKYHPSYATVVRPRWSKKTLEACTPEQRALLEPAYLVDGLHFYGKEPQQLD